MRESGILLPISSIPSDYGIGGFSKEAYRFVDFLKMSGVKNWQILPLGPTGYGDSPYQSFSTFAGNPYFIDLEALINKGMLTKKECTQVDCGKSRRRIDYSKIFGTRSELLRLAFDRSDHKDTEEYQVFIKENAYWLEDYALYMTVKKCFNGDSWDKWAADIRLRKVAAVKKYGEKYAEELEFYRFEQFLFAGQWAKLKAYANENGVRIIGDIPIYVAFDSADAWSSPKLFMFDKEGKPIEVAGCPPDAFSATGQLWGNPLYDWKYHKSTGYEWWISRMKHCFDLYDVVRVDHFRGFDEFYAIPYGAPDAVIGKWRKGPGLELFEIIKEKLGEVDIIAEDLGFLTESVITMVKKTGYPGMKILQFAFDSREPSNYLPHNYDKNCVVYTGTHDNDTTRGWYKALSKADKAFSIEYMNNASTDPKNISWDFIRMALSSVAKLAVIPMQDYLSLDSNARINRPSVLGNNWQWRMLKSDISEELARKIYRMNWIYGRL